ncbi:hypothetical protein, partial [Pseudomonas sp.]|uniref:hypothetical protein n=1 Tax=Pseudomonas sp. TaxID=306 RepID=UPI003FD87D5A
GLLRAQETRQVIALGPGVGRLEGAGCWSSWLLRIRPYCCGTATYVNKHCQWQFLLAFEYETSPSKNK